MAACEAMPDGFAPGLYSLRSGPLLAGPLHGEAGESDAFVWAQARDTSPLTLRVFRPGRVPHKTLTVTPTVDDWLCVRFHVQGLTAGHRYEYELESRHGKTPRHRLRAAPPASARTARIVFGSCLQDWRTGLPIFTRIAEEQADLVLLVGDNSYLEARPDGNDDWDSAAGMMRTHLIARNSDGVRRVVADTSTLAIWDDHDYGPNDSGGGFSGKERSLCCFTRMWAQRSYGTAAVKGVFSSVRCGPVQVLLLDGRFHRKGGRILGAGQLEWLEQQLRTSSAPVKLVVSGSQVLPEAAVKKDWECWRRDAPDELRELQRFIAEEDIRGVVFASGDVHLGYLLSQRGRTRADGRRGPEQWELTASPLTGDPWYEGVMRGDKPVYDRFVLHELPLANYGVVDVDLDRAGAEIRLSLGGMPPAPAPPLPLPFVRHAVSLGALRVRPAKAPRLSAITWKDERIYFFRGDRYVRYDLAAGHVVHDQPRRIADYWKGLFDDIEAALDWGDGKAYFFRGNGYLRYDVDDDATDNGYPTYIARHWHGVPLDFTLGLDAAVRWPNDKAYLFRGSQYVRYDVGDDRVDAGYPCPIAQGWKGLFPSGIEAAIVLPDGMARFFRGGEFVRWDVERDCLVDDKPLRIVDHFPGVEMLLAGS